MAATFKVILAPLRLIIISYRNHQFMLVQIYLIVMTGFCMMGSINCIADHTQSTQTNRWFD